MEERPCTSCPEGHILKEGKCVLPEVTFTAFLMSLNSAALFHLGELADPETGRKETDLSLAKHSIDTISMLQDKTKGNLSAEEKGLLEDVLFDLKLRYVKLKK
ncbi:MAG: DUF1844 domain-containing protein [Thermodesulfobacteriota bacterium]